MLIVDKLPIEIILGNDFLLNNEAIIHFTEENIQLSGLIVNFESKNKLKNKNDNKTLCNYEENDIKNYINSTSKFKKLGSYSKEKHKIHLFDKPKIISKQHPVPFSLRNEQRDHINNLISKNYSQVT
ncbi:hypothetical protein DMUE_1730 [Dictyocoela muelleri]|nr:hypothetical protein DMUE_1730 [Dictyocoela muelleri]